MRLFLLALLCLTAPLPATAAQLDYTVYVLGVPALEATASLDLAPASYRAAIDFRTVGVAGVAFRGHQSQQAQGVFAGERVAPLSYAASGTWRGVERSARLAFRGDTPVATALLPPEDVEREPVPPALLPGTLDPISVLVALLRAVADTGRCDGTARSFDGRRVVAFQTRTAGEEILPSSGRSAFAGRALRCEVVNQVVAGRRMGEDGKADAAPKRATIWLAPPFPGARNLPVRVVAETRLVGDATVYLTRIVP